MSDFKPFAQAIHERYTDMSQQELYVTVQDKDALWGAYLAGFPAGSDPIYKTHTEHTCSCCRHFVKNLGNVVSIVNGKVQSIWSVPGLESPYKEVAAYMDAFVTSAAISDLFRSSERAYGAQQTKQLLEGGTVKVWNHFYGSVAARHFSPTPDAVTGAMRTTVQVLERGLTELDLDQIGVVLELIDSNALYRGAEHREAVSSFQNLQQAYRKVKSGQRATMLWTAAQLPVARFRNTVIGTLVQDLSEGVPLERAVASFETKVAPTNYKRTTALVTPKMIEAAMITIDQLGLEPALQRRFAKLSDVSVNNVLWVNSESKARMVGGLENLLLKSVKPSAVKPTATQDITIHDFMSSVLPTATSIDMLVQGKHQGNFVSLTAPIHSDSPHLFKWSNDFGWSYDGNITDAIKERVKAAGGSVEGDVCCRLAWDSRDDLDLHMYEPDTSHIYYGVRRRPSHNGGILDVDANGADGQRDDPVENIYYADKRTMRPGTYSLVVHKFSGSSPAVPFTVQIEIEGVMVSMHHEKGPRTGERIEVATLTVDANKNITLKSNFPTEEVSQEKWGVQTQTFTKVQTVMYSPNYWDENAVGNKHWMFMLEGCKNPAPTRGIYNEFLRSDLEQHRKVFELVGARTQCEPVDDQLSGLGFSSTKADTVVLRVNNRLYNVSF